MSIRTALPALAILLALTGCVPGGLVPRTTYTERPVVAPPPPEGLDVEAYAARNEGRDGVFVRVEVTDEHGFGLPKRDDWQYVEDRRTQYIILDPEAEWLSTQTIRVGEGGTLLGVASRVTGPDGTTQTFGVEDFQVEQDGSDRVYKLAYPDIRRGSVVDEAFRISYASGPNYVPPLREEYRLAYPLPVDTLRVRYIYPSGWGLQVKSIGPRVIPAYSSDLDTAGLKQRILTFERYNVPAYEDEPFSPYFKETAEYVDLRVTSIRAGQAEYDPPKTWGELAEQFSKYAFRKGGLFSNPVGNAVGQAVPDETVPDSLKLAQIVGWVQNNIEIGEPSRDDLTRVVREGKGSPFQICGLTQAMLDRVGIEAEFLLIHPTSEGYFDREYVTGSQFPIPAVGAEVDGLRYVVFPFIEGLPVNYVPEQFQGAEAMRITPDGFGGFTQVPDRDYDTYAVDIAYDVEIDADGVLRVEETTTLRGIAAYSFRKRFEDLDADEREEEIRDLLTYTEGDVEDLTYTLSSLDDFGVPLEIVIRYTIDNLVTVTPEEVLFQTGGLLSPASLSAFKVDTRDRTLPIRIYYDQVTNKTITLRYPEAWSLTTQLEDVIVENEFGRIEGAYTTAPGRVVADQRIHLKESSASRYQYRTLLRLTGTESELYVPTLVFSVDR